MWANGRHNRGVGYTKDCQKHNAAVLDGWTPLWFTGDMVTKGTIARDTTLAVLERLRSEPTRRPGPQEEPQVGALSSPEVAYRPVVTA